MNKIQNSIILGALLHDLEKKLSGENFLNNSGFFDAVNNICDTEVLKDCLFCKQESIYFKIISLANKFQSGEGIEKEKRIKNETKLVNLFPNISIKEDRERQDKDKIPLQKLVYSNLGEIFGKKGDYSGDYKEDFKKEIQEIIKQKNLSFDALLSFFVLVLQKYLWCLPANTEDEFPDVSLWEHSALTSAIANCFYLYLENSGSFNLEGIKKAEDEKAFRLIIGDFSGIQNYIFNIQKMPTAAKRLKGRSFLVQMISDDIKNFVLEDLKLPSLNTIICAGGKFAILVPNTKDIEGNFEDIKHEVENKVFNRFKGEIRFNLALSEPFDGKKFGESTKEKENFGKYYDDAFIEVSKQKYKPFSTKLLKNNQWQEKEFVREDLPDDRVSNKSLCKLCLKYIIDERYKDATKMAEENVCENCGEEIELGKILRKENKFIVWKEKEDINKKGKGEIKLIFKNIKMVGNFDEFSDKPITIINPEDEDIGNVIENCKAKIDARFFATYVAKEKNGEIKDFATILDDELGPEKRKKGFRKLAILKGDVDNLGKIFYFGLKNYKNLEDNLYTATRLKTLSLYINLFFEGYIDQLARSDKRFNDLYIVFSGGDDFTIVGYWETLIEFARVLNENFKKFACGNSEIHFSASLHLMDEKWPIYEEIKKAEEELKEAKDAKEKGKEEKEKDRVWIFGKTLKWNDFEEIKELTDGKNGFQKFIESGVSLGYLWKLHKISKMIYNYRDESKKRSLREKAYSAMWRPYLYYFTERNLEKNPLAKNWVEKNLLGKGTDENIIKNLDIFTTYLLYKNRK